MSLFRRACACAVLLACLGAPLYADLSKFREKVVAAEREADEEEEEEEKPDTRTEEQKMLDELLVTAILRLWFYLNFAVDYDDYPYASGKYVRFRADDASDWKFYRFSVGADVFLAPDSGAGS